MTKIDLGHPNITTHDRQSPQDYILYLREKYKHMPNADLTLLIYYDRQEKEQERRESQLQPAKKTP